MKAWVFSHMTHLNRMRERFTSVQALRVTGGPALRRLDANAGGRQRLSVELPQVEETGCWRGPRRRVGTGVYRSFSEARNARQHPVRTLLPDMTAHARYQRKYRHYLHLIEALQGAIHPY